MPIKPPSFLPAQAHAYGHKILSADSLAATHAFFVTFQFFERVTQKGRGGLSHNRKTKSDRERLCREGAKNHSLLHPSPSEQGGFSQRSSRPQHVRPAKRCEDCSVKKPAERILSISEAPQLLH
jgi:hypothetical protein